MKKLVFTLGLCLVASISFGQKKAVADALKLAKDPKPNFTEARALIKGALENAETKNDPKTWYTAGQIESLQFDQENTKQMLQQQADDEVMFSALIKVYPYFLEAYKLDNLPDAKGKIKPKFTKDIKSIMRANLPFYWNGGGYYFDNRDFKKAIEFFDQYIEISDNPIMKDGEKVSEVSVDSFYLYSNYYAAVAAGELEDHELTVKTINRARNVDFKQQILLQTLVEEYKRVNDTVNMEKYSNEGMALYPKDDYFLIALINIYLNTNRNEKAIEYINTALQNNPDDAILFNSAGRIYEIIGDNFEKSEECYKRSIELDGQNAESQSNIGRLYYYRGIVLLDEANDIKDIKKYNEEKEKVKDLLRKALPHYELAFKLNPDSSDNKIALRSIYYNLEMDDKFKEMDDLINESN